MWSRHHWTVHLVAATVLFQDHPPVFVAGVLLAGAAVVPAPMAVVGDLSWLGTGEGVMTALWLGLVSRALSYVMFARGLGATPVATTATLTLAEPVTAARLGMLVLDRPVRATTITGIALVALG